MVSDLYAVLGVSPDATELQLKQAYRQLARRTHPDKRPGDPLASDEFKRLNAAYNVLANPKQRAAYDQQRATDFAAAATAAAPPVTPRAPAKKSALERAVQAAHAEAARGRPVAPSPPRAKAQPKTGPPSGVVPGSVIFPPGGAGFLRTGAAWATSNSYDEETGRYRGPGGRFKSGKWD